MYAVERQQRIVRATQTQGRVDVTTLAEELDVTAETVRRDLASLEARGLVHRVHGGALPSRARGFEPTVENRTYTRAAQKNRIAAAALDLLDDGVRSILLDAGTTTTVLATTLPTIVRAGRELTVVTNSLTVAAALSPEPRIHLHVLGGRIRSRTMAAVGSGVEDQLRRLTVDITFLGANGVHAERGVTTPNDDEAAAKRAMCRAGDSVVVLADSTKVGRSHLCRVVGVDAVHTLITDDELDPDLATELGERGAEVVTA